MKYRRFYKVHSDGHRVYMGPVKNLIVNILYYCGWTKYGRDR